MPLLPSGANLAWNKGQCHWPNGDEFAFVRQHPVVDPTYRSKLVAVRAMREMLAGIAMCKSGITDPFYVDPLWGEWDNGAE